ncbi:hypothetical protein [Pseudalkalibacillus decolorationis]|uniref:hypothetical protein n=1 Tax=Pseudalkalibacillus decolorationis TaxID=163879 RepID=UPI003CD0CB56
MKLAELAGIKGSDNQDTISNFIQAIVDLQKKIELPTTLKEVNVPIDLLSELANSSEGMERLQSNSPKRLTQEEILAVFKRAMNGEFVNKGVTL